MGRLNSGSHEYTVQWRIAVVCFVGGALYIPAMILFRLALAAVRLVLRRRGALTAPPGRPSAARERPAQ